MGETNHATGELFLALRIGDYLIIRDGVSDSISIQITPKHAGC